MLKKYGSSLGCAVLMVMIVGLPRAFPSELIEPTRSLEGAGEVRGQLSVFSEPPELTVTLDGNEIGLTPVIGYTIEAGVHELKVTDIIKEIYILPGQSLKLSLYKDTFVVIPETDEEVTKRPAPEETPDRVDKKVNADRGEDEELQPLYWPLDPKGPIY